MVQSSNSRKTAVRKSLPSNVPEERRGVNRTDFSRSATAPSPNLSPLRARTDDFHATLPDPLIQAIYDESSE